MLCFRQCSEYDSDVSSYESSTHLMKFLNDNPSSTQDYADSHKKNSYLTLDCLINPSKLTLPANTNKLTSDTHEGFMATSCDVFEKNSLNNLFEPLHVAQQQQRWQPDSTFKEDNPEVNYSPLYSMHNQSYLIILAMFISIISFFLQPLIFNDILRGQAESTCSADYLPAEANW